MAEMRMTKMIENPPGEGPWQMAIFRGMPVAVSPVSGMFRFNTDSTGGGWIRVELSESAADEPAKE